MIQGKHGVRSEFQRLAQQRLDEILAGYFVTFQREGTLSDADAPTGCRHLSHQKITAGDQQKTRHIVTKARLAGLPPEVEFRREPYHARSRRM